MTAPDQDVKRQLDRLANRYGQGLGPDDDNEIVDLVQRLLAQFPGDVGIFCAFVLNYVKLEPRQAIFLGAGEPHAYIAGGGLLFSSLNSYSGELISQLSVRRLHRMHGKF